MLSPKVIVILALVIAFLVYLASVAINPYSLYQTEFSFIPSITNWDVYFLTVFVPLSILYGSFFNAAGNAINPLNKRYANTAKIIIILVIIAAVWFFLTNELFIPYLQFFLYSSLKASFLSDISFLSFAILSIIGLPLLCVAIAAPVNTAIALKSLSKWFKRVL